MNTPDCDEATVVALGGNLAGSFGSPAAAVEAALECLSGAGLRVLERSSLWASMSWPDPSLPAYINAVALVEPTCGPRRTLRRLKALERVFGRRRGCVNAPRVLDLDLIACGRKVIEAPDLQLPHPRAHERLFVMGPLAEIAPGWRHPVLGVTADALAARASVGRDASPLPAHPR